MTSFILHIIAMSFMLCDHLWGTGLVNLDLFGYIGRMAFPIFAFLFVEGFMHTKNRKKYAMQIFVVAILSEIPFDYMMEHSWFQPFHQNVLWLFLLGILVLQLYEICRKKKNVILRVCLCACVMLLGYLFGFLLFVDYFGYGILVISLFYFTRIRVDMRIEEKRIRGLIQFVGMYVIQCEMIQGMMILITMFGIEFEIYKQGFAILALLFIWLYRGEQGLYNRTVKWVYYLFYPVHMLVLSLF